MVTMGTCPMVTMGSHEKSLKVTMGGRRSDAYSESAANANVNGTAVWSVESEKSDRIAER